MENKLIFAINQEEKTAVVVNSIKTSGEVYIPKSSKIKNNFSMLLVYAKDLLEIHQQSIQLHFHLIQKLGLLKMKLFQVQRLKALIFQKVLSASMKDGAMGHQN